jgi:D-3-phosphoglycerate dehydrogenase
MMISPADPEAPRGDLAALTGTVLVTSRSFGSGHADPAAALAARGLEIRRGDHGHDVEALAAELATAVGWIAGTGPIDARHLDLAPNLRVIARYGVGVEAVDLAAAAAHSVTVTNTPGANAESVADHALALMLAAARHLVTGDRSARAGDWSARPGRELSALTIGIVGFGRIGQALAHRLVHGFGARVLVHDPYIKPEAVHAAGAKPCGLAALAQQADVLSLHVPGGGQPLIDAELLATMRPGAILVNTARGDLLDEAAVAAALTEGRLGALAVDVLGTEPAADSPVLDAPNVIVTPHLAAQTAEAVDRMGTMAADEVLRILSGDPPLNPVTPPTTTEATR